MLVLVDPNDSRTVRNKDMILDHYDMMITKKDVETGTRNFDSGYIQHNPLMADGRVALAKFLGEIARGHDRGRIVVHKIIAVGARTVETRHSFGGGVWSDGGRGRLHSRLLCPCASLPDRADTPGRQPNVDAYVARGEARPAYVRAFEAQLAVNAPSIR